jgi:hypothetical protein
VKNSEVVRILSPLLFFVFHVIYLVTSSPDPFLKKWLEGSFTFFLALVLCNIIRARVVASKDQGESLIEDHDGRDA